MKGRRRSAGFAMLEVLLVMLVLLAASASLLTAGAASMHRAVRQKERLEAYYAAVAAVRLFAGELSEGGELAVETGISAGVEVETGEMAFLGSGLEGVIEIQTEEAGLQVPVKLFVEQTEDGRLKIRAEATVGEQSRQAVMVLEALDSSEALD